MIKRARLWVRNWDKWQTYRSDRGMPPWIKLHRRILRDPDWLSLTDEQKGQLVSIWMLAADNGGSVPNDANLVRISGSLEKIPDLNLFQALGFLQQRRRQHDAPKAEAETDKNLSGGTPTKDTVIHVRWDKRGRGR